MDRVAPRNEVEDSGMSETDAGADIMIVVVVVVVRVVS